MNKAFFKIFFIIVLLHVNQQQAKDILIYANTISYDSDENLIAKGNAKIISNNEIITSDLIILNKEKNKFILPTNFNYKDDTNNYYYGSSGEFSKELNNAIINDIKLLLNDGSRIVGKKAKKINDIDIITKASYSPCASKIRFKNFICPIWQLEGEKILHDNDKLFLYQKHSKLKIINTPVFYLPYIVTPSPLRKERKSGFLSPIINFNFLDTKVSQSTSLPYYFNISIDKELTFTPVIKYGGGVDSSQRFLFDYNQLLSGGNLNIDLSVDSTLEKENNERWFKDGSIITNYNQNINEKFSLHIDSALQTSRKYIQITDPDSKLSYKTSLSSTVNLKGYALRDKNDYLLVNVSSYQVVKSNEDNKTTPTAFPYISYNSGEKNYKKIKYENIYQFYNLFREIATADHAQNQQKASHTYKLNTNTVKYKSKIDFKSEIHNQAFQTENKNIDGIASNNQYYRIFPMSGIYIETPIKEIKTQTLFTPKASLILNSGQSNSNKISNETSTNNIYNITNLNRYSGTDKLDNSKRINYGLNISKNKLSFNFDQNYEFTNNSNYHKEIGNKNYLSDSLSNISYNSEENILLYSVRYDHDVNYIKNQSLGVTNNNKYSTITADYVETKQETNRLVEKNAETLNTTFKSNKINKYSELSFTDSYDLIENKHKEYKVQYSYFDECFGINLNFKRNFYEDDTLKPQDNLTIMFSFKNLGSYKSTNLAVSETDKQDIKWEGSSIDNEKFN